MLPRHKKKFFITGLIVLVVLAAMSWASFYAFDRVVRTGRDLAVAEQELAEAVRRGESLRREPMRSDQLQNAKLELERFFISTENPLVFIEAVEELGRRTGVEVNLTLFESTRSGKSTYSLSVSGSYVGVMQFVEKFEFAPLAFKLKELRLDSSAQIRLPEGLKVKSSASPPLREFRAEIIVVTFDVKAKQ